jgi:hypothetical protein
MISNDLNIFLILLSAMMVNNILLIRFIALCSFFGISNSIKTSIGMGMAVIFVMVMATAVSWPVYHFILVPLDLVYLRVSKKFDSRVLTCLHGFWGQCTLGTIEGGESFRELKHPASDRRKPFDQDHIITRVPQINGGGDPCDPPTDHHRSFDKAIVRLT